MKRNTKHKFTHKDPELSPKIKRDIKAAPRENDDFKLIKKDLVRTGITMTVFVAIIIALYVIKVRTDWFTILLSKIGL